jgi:hypothetical protein
MAALAPPPAAGDAAKLEAATFRRTLTLSWGFFALFVA